MRAANPKSGERLSVPRVRLLLDSQTGQLVNTGQLVKASSQLWSKLQKWLNRRGRIGNWTEIKFLITYIKIKDFSNRQIKPKVQLKPI